MPTLRPLFSIKPQSQPQHHLTHTLQPLLRRTFRTTFSHRAQSSYDPHSIQPEKPVNFYRTYGRAFAKVLTLAFLTYQVTYWYWLVVETEAVKDQKNREIRSLEGEVRLLDEGRKGHRPGGGVG